MRNSKIWLRLNKSPFLRSLLQRKIIGYLFYALFPPDGYIGIPFYQSYSRFFSKVNLSTTDYAVLRWPELLKGKHNCQEIDILATTQASSIISSMCFKNPILCRSRLDISIAYNSSDLIPGIPYYPPKLSQLILANKTKSTSSFYFLSGKIYLLSLVYHIVIHKGFQSLVPSKSYIPANITDNKYIEEMNRLSESNNQDLPPLPEHTLESLYSWLDKVNWLPPIDTYIKFQKK